MKRRLILMLLMTVASLSLAGCSDLVDQDQLNTSLGNRPLDAERPIGQTFVAHHAGLQGVEVFLVPGQGGDGEVNLHLRADPQSTQDVISATLPLKQVTTPRFYRFTFSPLPDSHGRYYYTFLEVKGTGTVQVAVGPGNTYLDGAMYRQHEPVDKQVAFRLAYDFGHVILDLLRTIVNWAGLWIMAGLLYTVPGWALLAWVVPDVKLPWAEKLGVAAGLGLALYPLLMLWTNLVGWHLGPLYAWLPIALGLAGLVWRYRPWRVHFKHIRAGLASWPSSEAFWPDLVFVVLIILVSVGQFLMVQGLDMPLWDDSVEHLTIVKRILESGGLYQSWEPYAPYRTFSVHFGFHANIAAWAWLTRSEASQAVIWGGQILNILAVIALYPLAYRIKGAWSGVIAVLFAGMFSIFPANYTNWGRYAQMAGQAILPIAAWWLWVTLSEEEKPNRLFGLPGFLMGAGLVAGMALTYYRMAFHYLAFVLAALLVLAKLKRVVLHRRTWLSLVAIGGLAALLMSPWLQNIMANQSQLVREVQAASAQIKPASFWSQVQAVNIGWSAPVAALVFLGTLVALWASGITALPVIWLWLLMGLLVLRLTRWPGVNIIQEFTIVTSLYIPLALIWGMVGSLVVDKFAKSRWVSVVLAVVMVSVGVWKLPSLVRIIDRGYDLSTRPDVRAAQWINNHLPDDAFFLINGMVYTDGFSAIATDAGSWLPVWTRRGVVIPLQYALLTEQPNEPGYSQAVNDLIRRLAKSSPATPEGQAAICNFPYPITHLYLGQRRGTVTKAIPLPQPQPMLPADLLLQTPAFRLIYHQDRVMIFEFDRSVCS